VHVDGERIWDKKGRDGGFPEHAAILAMLADR